MLQFGVITEAAVVVGKVMDTGRIVVTALVVDVKRSMHFFLLIVPFLERRDPYS